MYNHPTSATLVNFALYQTGWFAVVLGGAWNYVAVGSALGLLTIGTHLLLVARSDPDNLRGEVFKAFAFLGLGVVVEGSNALLGLYSGTHGTLGIFSPWLLVLWPGFAVSFYGSLKWLNGRYLLAAALGAPLGPIAYYAGSRLGAITLSKDVGRIALLAVEWSVALPMMAWFSTYFAGRRLRA